MDASDAIVTAFQGSSYLAIHPGYSCSPHEYRRTYATRIVVSVLAFIPVVFNVVGQIIPFQVKTGYSFSPSYTVWDGNGYRTANNYAVPIEVTAVLSLAFNIVGASLAAVLAAVWVRHEEERRCDEASSALAQSLHGQSSPPNTFETGRDHFPQSVARNAQLWSASAVLYEHREKQRRRYERDVCAAALSMLIVAACFALTVFSLEAAYCKNTKGSRYNSVTTCELSGGFAVFVVCAVLLIVSFILLAIPQVMRIYLCGTLAPPHCELVELDDASVAALTSRQLLQSRHNAAVALPGLPAEAAAVDVCGTCAVQPTTAKVLGSGETDEQHSLPYGRDLTDSDTQRPQNAEWSKTLDTERRNEESKTSSNPALGVEMGEMRSSQRSFAGSESV